MGGVGNGNMSLYVCKAAATTATCGTLVTGHAGPVDSKLSSLRHQCNVSSPH